MYAFILPLSWGGAGFTVGQFGHHETPGGMVGGAFPSSALRFPGRLGGLAVEAAETTIFMYRSNWLDSTKLHNLEEI